MKNQTFTLRIDLESEKCIKALPRFLDLLKKYNLKASFYIVMGGESGIFNLLRFRKKLESSAERTIKLWSLKEKLRIAFFPRDFVRGNLDILRRILSEGHELGIHGWKHREWTRGLEKINIEKKIQKSINRYEEFFGSRPLSWTSPGFNINPRVLDALEKEQITFISDLPGDKPKFFGKIKNVPMTILGERKMPVIEYLVSNHKSDEEITRLIENEIKKKELASFYMHGLFEARFKLNVLEEIFKFVQKNKIKCKRIIDY